MNEYVNRTLWRIFWFKWGSGSLKILVAAYLTGVASTRWTDMNWDARITMFCGALVCLLTNWESLADQTAAKIAAGKPPIGTNGGGHTEVFARAQVEVKPEPPKE